MAPRTRKQREWVPFWVTFFWARLFAWPDEGVATWRHAMMLGGVWLLITSIAVFLLVMTGIRFDVGPGLYIMPRWMMVMWVAGVLAVPFMCFHILVTGFLYPAATGWVARALGETLDVWDELNGPLAKWWDVRWIKALVQEQLLPALACQAHIIALTEGTVPTATRATYQRGRALVELLLSRLPWQARNAAGLLRAAILNITTLRNAFPLADLRRRIEDIREREESAPAWKRLLEQAEQLARGRQRTASM